MLSKLMLKKLGMILLAMSISALLSSCLVDKQKVVEKIARKTDTLRIYQENDWIDYNVTVVNGSATPQYGTLRIQWTKPADLTDPITPTTKYPVFKETTTLTYDGSTQPDVIVVRYISQVKTTPMVSGDPGIGSIILHAIDDEVDKDYWPYPDRFTPSTSPVISPMIFKSPLSVGSSFPATFSIMECTSGQCAQEIYNFTDDTFVIVGDTREVTTNLGIFSDPFEINFTGGIVPASSAPAVTFLGDIRDACGTSAERITHNGKMFVVPEIGIIQMTNTCIDPLGASVSYIITVRDTSFTF
jgi:hypothetical protein